MLSETVALATRELKKWLRQPVTIVFTFIQPLLWLSLFGKSVNFANMLEIPPTAPPQIAEYFTSLRDQILLRLFGTLDYFSYMACGVMAIYVFFSSMFSGLSIVWDRRLGFLARVMVTPAPRETIFLSKVTSNLVRSILQFLAIFAIAYALGLQLTPEFGLVNLLVMVAAVSLLSLMFSSMFLALALRITSHEALIAVVNLVNLPLMFASNALFPTKQMPNWLRPVAEVSPITFAVRTIRWAVLGSGSSAEVFTSLGVLSILAVASLALGAILTGKFLKPR